MEQPLVTVICLCYNHARFVEEAVNSVLSQTYPAIELILVDDKSNDNSVEIIHRLAKQNHLLKVILNDENIGMCRSFNKALSMANGEYIIDLAADDMLMPQRIEEQVAVFLSLKLTYGVVYSDAYLIDEKGEKYSTFYKRNELGGLMEKVPSGEVFRELIRSYRICSPTIMVRKKMLDELGGYDERLSYEDYDFFIRSSRNYKYFYIDKPLTLKREVKGSDSSSWYKTTNNVHLTSTLMVCKKALWLCNNEEERRALLHSVRYHFRQSYFLNCFQLAEEYCELIDSMNGKSWLDNVILRLSERRISVYPLFEFYLKIRKN